jgi:NAD+ synthase
MRTGTKIPKITAEDVNGLKSFISETVAKANAKGVVIGLSGGIDSAVVTKLCADALGPKNVLNVFMPSRVTPADDYKTTSELSSMWGTEFRVVDVQPAVDALAAVLLSDAETPLERGNISARCRMIVLYNLAKKRQYLVMGTSNQSEIMMGYFTKFGDGACDATPLANMYKTQVRQIAAIIGVPQPIIDKPPSAGLWEGQTDESEMGIMYKDLDAILYGMEQDMTDSQIADDTGLPKEKVQEIRRQVQSMEHKRLPAKRPSEYRSSRKQHSGGRGRQVQ